MIETAALLVIILVSILAIRAGAVALTMTGVSLDMATFQSLSAFTGTGFTTTEAESIVGHPARRRIIQALMLLGNAGLFSALAALILSFSQANEGANLFLRLLATIAGLTVLLLLSASSYLNRQLNRVLQKLFARVPLLKLQDYEALLRMNKGYAINHLNVEAGSWLSDRTLRDVDLISEGLLVLSLERPNGFIVGTPGPNTLVRAGDQLLVYGQEEDVEHLGHRNSGDEGEQEHRDAVERQRLRRAHESADDRD